MAQAALMQALEGVDPLGLSSEELEAASGEGLGELDLTTQQLSLAGLEKELEALEGSEVLRRILDEGAHWAGGRKRRRRRLGAACCSSLTRTPAGLALRRRGPARVQPPVRGTAAPG